MIDNLLKLMETKDSASQTFGHFVTKDRKIVPYSYSACFYGLATMTPNKDYKYFCFYVPSLYCEKGSVIKWMARQAQNAGFKFSLTKAKKGEVQKTARKYVNREYVWTDPYPNHVVYICKFDLEEVSATELFLVGTYFRLLWEYPQTIKAFLQITKKFKHHHFLHRLIVAHMCNNNFGHSWINYAPRWVSVDSFFEKLRGYLPACKRLKYVPEGHETVTFALFGEKSEIFYGLHFDNVTKVVMDSFTSKEKYEYAKTKFPPDANRW